MDRNDLIPKEGTKGAKVWAIATKISEEKLRPASRNEIYEEGKNHDIALSTLRVNYSRWKRYWGIEGEIVIDAEPEKAENGVPFRLPGNGQVLNDSTPYDHGWEAFRQGQDSTSCPYDEGSAEANAWQQGHRESSE